MYFQQFIVDGQNQVSYLVGCDVKGEAAVIDADRDVQKYLDAAAAQSMRITHIIETDLHADHVSGNTDLAACTGAVIYIHEAAEVEFEHLPLKDGDNLVLGSLRITVHHMPERTPESVTLQVSDITGTDQALMALSGSLPEPTGNHSHIQVLNRKGPKLLGTVLPKPIAIHDAIPYFRRGAVMLDTRSKEAFVTKHVQGAVNLPADEQLSSRVGALLPPDLPVVLVVNDEVEYRQVVYSLARVGFDNVVGYLEDGLRGWEAYGLPTTRGDLEDITSSQLAMLLKTGAGLVVVDVREPWEFQAGHVVGAKLIPLGQLARRLVELDPSQPVAVVCQSGSRSQSAATLLAQTGFNKVYNVLGGMSAWRMIGLEVSLDSSL